METAVHARRFASPGLSSGVFPVGQGRCFPLRAGSPFPALRGAPPSSWWGLASARRPTELGGFPFREPMRFSLPLWSRYGSFPGEAGRIQRPAGSPGLGGVFSRTPGNGSLHTYTKNPSNAAQNCRIGREVYRKFIKPRAGPRWESPAPVCPVIIPQCDKL